MSDVWNVLGLEATQDRNAIRRAYARRLRATHPEDDPDGFMQLREAYEHALAWLEHAEAVAAMEAAEAADAIAIEDVESGLGQPVEAQLSAGPEPGLPDVQAEHHRRVARLGELVAAEQPADPARVEAAFADLLASPAMDEIDTAASTQDWIARLILHHAPHSDPLVGHAIRAFGWDSQTLRPRDGGLADAVLARADDIALRGDLLRRANPHHRAFAALRRPAAATPPLRERWSPAFEARMTQLLATVLRIRPGLQSDVDPQSLAFWAQRLQGPRLSMAARWFAVLAPLAPALLVLLLGEPLAAAVVYAAGCGAALLAAAAYSYGLAVLRARWRDDWKWRSPWWWRIGWLPTGLAVVLASGLAPDNAFSVAAVVVAGCLLAVWAAVTGDIARLGSWRNWLSNMAWLQAPLIGCWAVLQVAAPAAAPAPLAFAAAGLALALVLAGADPTELIFAEAAPRVRAAILAGLLVATLAAGLVLLAAWRGAAPAPLAAAATVAAVLALRPAAPMLGADSLQSRYWLMLILLLLMIALSETLGWLLACGLWLLVGAGFTIVACMLVERDRRRAELAAA